MRYDAVVVGSGIGGASAAVALAREGFNVVVVERNRESGGLMRTYGRAGQVVPTGIHILGSLDEGEILWRYFKYLDVIDRVKFERMEGETGFEVRFPGLRFRMRGGVDEFQEDLISLLESDGRVVRRFVTDMRSVVSEFPLYAFHRREKKIVTPMGRTSLAQYFDTIGASTRQRALLSALNPFYAVPVSQCPLPMHLLTTDSLVRSRWRPDERASTFAQAFEAALARMGGSIVTAATVTAIETGGRSVRGVRLESGDVLEASKVIYTGHPKRLLELLPEGTLRPAFRERLAGLVDTASVFGIVAVCDDPGQEPDCGCVLDYAGFDTEKHYSEKPLAEGDEPSMFFVSIGPHTGSGWFMKAIVDSQAEEWARWAHTTSGRRGEDYLNAKAALAERILAVVCRRLAIEPGKMRLVDSFSPLTLRDYSFSPECGIYGVLKSLESGSAANFSGRTRIEGLYLAGQSILVPGVVGTVISAMDAVAGIIGYDSLMDSVERATR